MSLTGGRAGQGGWMLLAVMSVAAVVFFFNLGDAQLWDRDEPRNAGCAVEMMQRGDWVVPIFNGELRFQKPVLLYWLIMSAYHVGGVNEFTARFWSALLAVATVGITFLIAKKLFDLKTAFGSGIILCSSLMFVVAARAATPDSALIFFSTLAIGCFVGGSANPAQHDTAANNDAIALPTPRNNFRLVRSFHELSFGWLILMGVSMAMAMLAKGPVGFVMPMAIMGMFLLIVRSGEKNGTRRRDGELDQGVQGDQCVQGVQSDQSNNAIQTQPKKPPAQILPRIVDRLRSMGSVIAPAHFVGTTLAMRPLLLLSISLLVAAPWYILVGMRTEGDFLRIFFLSEHLGRATTTFESHRGGLWFYPVAILIGFFPWSLFWTPVAIILYRLRRQLSDGMLLGICWAGVQVGIFSIVQTKLPSYVTPCYPALAMLTAACLQISVQRPVMLDGRWMVAVMATGIGVSVFITATATAAVIYFLPGQWSLPTAGLVLMVATGAALFKVKSGNLANALRCFSIGAVVFVTLLFGVGAGDVASIQNNRKLLDPVSQLPPEVAVASFNCLESSWSFYSRRTIHETSSDAKAKSIQRSKFWKPKPVTTPQSFAQQNRRCVFITTDAWSKELLNQLPDDYVVLVTADYFFKRGTLVLVGPADSFSALPPNQRSP